MDKRPYYAIKDIAENLRADYPKLSLKDSLLIAAQINRNDILESGLITWASNAPTGLEAIAMALGFDVDKYQGKKNKL